MSHMERKSVLQEAETIEEREKKSSELEVTGTPTQGEGRKLGSLP